MASKPFRPYIVIYSRAVCPDDHVAFELGARNHNKARKSSQHMIKQDAELKKLGLLVHRATLRILGEYSEELGGDGLAIDDTDELADISFEDLTRMCDVWVIDNSTLRRVETEEMCAPIDNAGKKEASKAMTPATTTTPAAPAPTNTYIQPFTEAVLAKCAEQVIKYNSYNRAIA